MIQSPNSEGPSTPQYRTLGPFQVPKTIYKDYFDPSGQPSTSHHAPVPSTPRAEPMSSSPHRPNVQDSLWVEHIVPAPSAPKNARAQTGVPSKAFGLFTQHYGSFRKLGLPYFGVLILRILLFNLGYCTRVPYFRKLHYRHRGAAGSTYRDSRTRCMFVRGCHQDMHPLKGKRL